jgi:hypothetical protein
MYTLKELYNELRNERGNIKVNTLIDASVDFSPEARNGDDRFDDYWKVSYLMRPAIMPMSINQKPAIQFWMTCDHPKYNDPGCVEHILDIEFNKDYDDHVLYVNAYNKHTAQFECVPVQEMRIENGPQGEKVVHLVAFY